MITLTTSALVVYGLPTVLVLAVVAAVLVTAIFHMVRRKDEPTHLGRTLAQQKEWAAGGQPLFPTRR